MVLSCEITPGKGSRIGPEKEKPSRDESQEAQGQCTWITVEMARHGAGNARHTEDGVDDVIGAVQSVVKVLREGDFEVLQLLGESLQCVD